MGIYRWVADRVTGQSGADSLGYIYDNRSFVIPLIVLIGVTSCTDVLGPAELYWTSRFRRF